MDKKVLVLTNSKDGEHTDIVIERLKTLGQQIFRLNVDELANSQIEIKLNAGNSTFEFEFINNTDGIITSSEIKSVWYRRPFYYDLQIKDPVQKIHVEKELDGLLEGLWRTLNSIFWLNSPISLEQTRKKMLQLKIASEIGFNIPKTIITNNPDEAKKFILECKDGAIFKTIHSGFLDYGDKAFNIPTTFITREHIQKLDLIKKCPSLFQECIVKDYELRITIVGTKIFPIKIDSQKYDFTSVDWRHPDLIDKLNYELVEIPNDIILKCQQLMNRFGLYFGAFDFAVDKQGNFYFFEINANGQWYWLEKETGALISHAISDILISES